MAAKSNAQAKSEAEKVRFSADGVYGEIQNFLIDEAAMLDQDLHMEWLDLLTDDIDYKMPFRHTVYRRDGSGFGDRDFRFNDNKQTLNLRARRNTQSASALDRDPPPRIHRMISNIVVHQGDGPDLYEASSSILLMRSRFDRPVLEMLSAKRQDVVRRTPQGLKLASRVIYTDLANLGNSFLNVFM